MIFTLIGDKYNTFFRYPIEKGGFYAERRKLAN